MRRLLFAYAFLTVTVLALGGLWIAAVGAQIATPVTAPAPAGATLILVERSDQFSTIDLGEPGTSAGDLGVWGPNPLYDEANVSDTGATTQGTCVALNAAFACVLTETIVFADGSTLQFQGVEPGGANPSLRTIVGGSGRYLGATGTAIVTPNEDFSLWTRTFEIVER